MIVAHHRLRLALRRLNSLLVSTAKRFGPHGPRPLFDARTGRPDAHESSSACCDSIAVPAGLRPFRAIAICPLPSKFSITNILN
jgi:hypothetical protein